MQIFNQHKDFSHDSWPIVFIHLTLITLLPDRWFCRSCVEGFFFLPRKYENENIICSPNRLGQQSSCVFFQPLKKKSRLSCVTICTRRARHQTSREVLGAKSVLSGYLLLRSVRTVETLQLLFLIRYNWHWSEAPSQQPSDNNYNDSFTFITRADVPLSLSLPLGEASRKRRVFNYKRKQTTFAHHVHVFWFCCNEGDTSLENTDIMLKGSDFDSLVSSSSPVQCNHHYCTSGNAICWYRFDPLIYMYLQ